MKLTVILNQTKMDSVLLFPEIEHGVSKIFITFFVSEILGKIEKHITFFGILKIFDVLKPILIHIFP